MRAVMLHGPGDVRVDEVDDPVAGAGEVVLAVDVAVTCATDRKMVRQGAHPALGPLPAPLGHEVVGVVEAVGPGVSSARVGQRVIAANSAPCGSCPRCATDGPCLSRTYMTGAFAPKLRVPAPIVARNLIPVPDGVPPARAALTEPLACAVRGADRCGAGPGDTVLILGGGVQGVFLTSLLARRGCRVIVSDPHPERRALARAFGADHTLDALRTPVDVHAARTILGGGVQYVVEAVGRLEAWEAAVAVAAPGGEVTLYGGCSPGSALSVDAAALHYGELRIQGSYHHTPSSVRRAVELLAADSRYELVLGRAISLDEVPAMLREGAGKHPVFM